MEDKHVLGPMLVTLFLTVFALPSPTLADDDGRGGGRLKAQLTQFNGGCPPNPVEEPGGCIDVQFSVHRAPACTTGPNQTIGDFSLSMVRKFADPGEPSPIAGGSSTLVRADDGVSTNLSTTELAPHAPYTMWWVGFNPDNPCVATCDCGGANLMPDVDAVFYATGALTDKLGSATFIANVEYGELPNGEDQIPFAPDFANPIEPGAEIHFVVRAHGPKLRGGGRDRDD